MIDPKHPRAISLQIREKLVKGVEQGLTSLNGLIAQGRGEAFDYLIGEVTTEFAQNAIDAAAAMLILAEYPVLSINGNDAALASKEYIQLAELLDCPIEINLFHRTEERVKKIENYLLSLGANNVLSTVSQELPEIASPRKLVSEFGIGKADVVFVPLEDGDRTEALIAQKKKVITIDVNPLSRTAQKATITIVDNIVRAMPLLIHTIEKFKHTSKEELERLILTYNNQIILKQAITHINNRLTTLAK